MAFYGSHTRQKSNLLKSEARKQIIAGIQVKQTEDACQSALKMIFPWRGVHQTICFLPPAAKEREEEKLFDKPSERFVIQLLTNFSRFF
jgi:hypothetical protein